MSEGRVKIFKNISVVPFFNRTLFKTFLNYTRHRKTSPEVFGVLTDTVKQFLEKRLSIAKGQRLPYWKSDVGIQFQSLFHMVRENGY